MGITVDGIRSVFSNIKIIKIVLLLWILYALITGVFIFIKPKEISIDFVNSFSVDDFYSEQVGPDRGILMDNPLESGLARLKIIDSAKETLDISYFSIESGEAPNLFFGALIDAADRGVKVNLLLDGIFYGLNGKFRSILYILIDHPNMNLKLYEPLNLLKPWTLNNRMHDKYIIADESVAIMGGRNIGDKYFAPEWYEANVTNDRDIIIINSKPGDTSSVIYQMSSYFNKIWNHEFSKPVKKRLFYIRTKRAMRKYEELRRKSNMAREENQALFEQPINLMEISFPINKASFIHNPLERFSKEPWCWYQITELMKSSKESIFIQSPYIIPNKQMIEGYLDRYEPIDIDITALTNSLGSTPNLPAYSGYIRYRKKLIDSGINVYEYQSRDSLHTKSFIIDDNLLAVGSFNSDPRSAYLSTESMLIIHSSGAVEKIEENVQDFFDKSLLVDEDYSYLPKEGVAIEPVNPLKAFAIYALSYIIRWFEFLL
ncbi:MAG: phospholipase D family protein [Clostridiales bacterium]|nr:phospholipase D family protein [Clostridiales bacterium]